MLSVPFVIVRHSSRTTRAPCRSAGSVLRPEYFCHALRWALCCSGLAVSISVQAQTLVGRVVLPDSTTPAARVLVTAQRINGPVLRALTSSSGRFVIHVDSADVYRLQVLRVGFQPTPMVPVRVERNREISVLLVAVSSPVSLTAVMVSRDRSCRLARDTGFAVSRVWEEARKVLWGTVLSSEEVPLRAEWITYTRVTDSSGRFVREQRVHHEQQSTRRAFRSISADSLSRVGYVVEESDGLRFHAPDADVLLDERFAGTHCFGLRDSLALSTRLVGLTFSPAQRRRSVHDIEGTMWFDDATAQLRALDFAYTNLPPVAPQHRGGGRIEFELFAETGWMVRSWYARLPVLVAPPATGARGTSQTRTGRVDLVVDRHAVSGGDLRWVSRNDSTLLMRQLPMLRLQLVAGTNPADFTGGTVYVVGTNLQGVVGLSGVVEIGPLPEGQYRVQIAANDADSLPAPPVERLVTISSAESVQTIVMPDRHQITASLCTKDSTTMGSALLRGTVLDDAGVAAKGTIVRVTFLRTDARAIRAGVVGKVETTRETSVDERGYWQLCGVPRDTDLRVEAVGGARRAFRQLRIDPARMSETVRLQFLR
jgi:hypothetical protein